MRELERLRDDNLVAILQALRTRRYAAGAVLHAHEARLLGAVAPGEPPDPSRPLVLFEGVVDPSWVDYNGHMTEARYLHVFAAATDALLVSFGVDADYLGRGLSAYTVETHIRHLSEVDGLEPIAVDTQIVAADAKRLHVFHTLRHGVTGNVLASGEHMLLHVDAAAGRTSAWQEPVASRVAAAAAAHAVASPARRRGPCGIDVALGLDGQHDDAEDDEDRARDAHRSHTLVEQWHRQRGRDDDARLAYRCHRGRWCACQGCEYEDVRAERGEPCGEGRRAHCCANGDPATAPKRQEEEPEPQQGSSTAPGRRSATRT